jgi:nitrous oxidase accessory protein
MRAFHQSVFSYLWVVFAVIFIYFFEVHAATLIVGDNAEFARIQDAIDAAKPGDSVEVTNGTYIENVTVEKPIILKGIGEPVVDARGSFSAITLSADGISLIGFNVTNSSNIGINIKSNNNLILGNIVKKSIIGILLEDCNNNTVLGNIVSKNNESGINLEQSIKNILMNNEAEGNGDTGIELEGSSENNVTENIVRNNSNDGIELRGAINNSIKRNHAQENKDGICLEEGSKNNTISNNYVNHDRIDGILIRSSMGNLIAWNEVSRNFKAIFLESSNDNILKENNISENVGGIHLNYYCYGNKIYRNNLVNSSDYNAYDESGNNQWYNGTAGNYYSDFDTPGNGCTDTNGNGTCDSGHLIPGSQNRDMFPLVSWHRL